MDKMMHFRFRCFGYHLLLSAIVACLSLALVFLLWYPTPLDKALGVTSIFILLLTIDVIVGPLLTLIVAKQGKKTLKMDFFIIGLIQFIALTYGLYIVAQGRPVWIVYNVNRFEVVQAYEAVPDASSTYFRFGFAGPVWGQIKDLVPTSEDRKNLYYQAKFLQPYKKTDAFKGQVSSLELLKRFNDRKKVDAVLKKYPNANGFIPLLAKHKSLSILIDKNTGALLAIVDLSPW